MTDHKNKLFIPLIVAAAISVIAFSGIGVAAITGHLSITHSSLNPFSTFGRTPVSGVTQPAAVSAANRHQGLTRNRGEVPGEGKPVNFQFGAKVTARKITCPDCGVVDSISPGRSRPAANMIRPPAMDASPEGLVKVGADADQAVGPGFVVRVHMENGTVRTIYETERPAFSVGERIKLVNGAVIRIG